MRTIAIAILLCLSSTCYGQVRATQSRTLSGSVGNINSIADWNSDAKLVGEGWPRPESNQSPQQGRSPTDCSTGDRADLSYWRFRVVQIINDTEAIVYLGESTYWVTGTNTRAVSDGQTVRLATPVQFIDRKEYVTVSGSKKIVKAMKMISQEDYLPPAKPKGKNEPEKDKDEPPKEYPVREWSTKDGRLRVKAKFLSRDGTRVVLEKEDGKRLNLDIDRLSTSDARYVNRLK